MPKQEFTLINDHVRARVRTAFDVLPKGWRVTFSPPRRSVDQNARLWAMLGEVSRAHPYYGAHRTPEDWKHIFTASLRGEQLQAVPSLDGKHTILMGLRTSKMTKAEMSDLFALIEMYCASHGITLTDNREAA